MLQIISGKFFNSDTVYSTPCKAVLYSNYYWPLKIETCIGTLEPIDNRSEINTYIFHYNNQIEKDMHSGFNLVRVGDPEIVQQFMLLCSFGLQAIFSTDKDEVERLLVVPIDFFVKNEAIKGEVEISNTAKFNVKE